MSNIAYLARIRSVAGAKLYWRQSGTSTPQNTYSDVDLTTPNANPMVANASGLFDVAYLDPSLPNYRMIHTDGSNDDDDPTLEVLLEDILDDIPSGNTTSSVIKLRSTSPYAQWEETDAASNSKKWRAFVNGGVWSLRYGNDAESSWTDAVQIDRSNGRVTIPKLYTLTSSGATLSISALEIGRSAYIFKTAATSRTNTTTPAADPVLQFTSAPAGTYRTEGVIIYDADTSGDFVLNWPRAGSSATGTMQYAASDASVTGVMPFVNVMTGDLTGVPFGVDIAVSINGVETATAGQTLGPEWCQGTSDAAATRVLPGSWLKVTRLT